MSGIDQEDLDSLKVLVFFVRFLGLGSAYPDQGTPVSQDPWFNMTFRPEQAETIT